MMINVPNPTSKLEDLYPLDTFYYEGDLWILTKEADNAGFRAALNLTTGSIVSISKNMTVVKVETTITSTAELKAIEDLVKV